MYNRTPSILPSYHRTVGLYARGQLGFKVGDGIYTRQYLGFLPGIGDLTFWRSAILPEIGNSGLSRRPICGIARSRLAGERCVKLDNAIYRNSICRCRDRCCLTTRHREAE